MCVEWLAASLMAVGVLETAPPFTRSCRVFFLSFIYICSLRSFTITCPSGGGEGGIPVKAARKSVLACAVSEKLPMILISLSFHGATGTCVDIAACKLVRVKG